jgi:hypothetical protein
MHLAVYLPLVMPLLAAAAARPLAGRLPPAAATWLLAGSSVVLAAASSAVLGLLTLTALVRIPLAGAAGEMSEQVIRQGDPASIPVAVAAGVLLASAAAPPRQASHASGALGAVTGPARMRGAGPVPRRVAALLSPPPQPRLLLLAAAVLLVAVTGASALEAARDLHSLLDYARAAGAS